MHPKSPKLAYVGLKGGGSCGSKHPRLDKDQETAKAKAKVNEANDKVQDVIKISPKLNQLKVSPMTGSMDKAKDEELAEDEKVKELYKTFEEEWQSENERLEANQCKAVELAKSLSKAMLHGTLDRSLLSKLSRISPYQCSVPQAIAELLLINLNQNAFWAGPQYVDDRAAISGIIRRFLMVQIMKYPRRALFTKQSVMDYLKILEGVKDRISVNEEQPEMCAQLEITAIIRIISNCKSTYTWWKFIVCQCSDIVMIAVSLRKFNPGPLINKICEFYSNVTRKSRGSYLDFMMELDVLEKGMRHFDEDNQDSIEDNKVSIETFLLHKINDLETMTWEEVHVLLEFIAKWIVYHMSNLDFAMKIISSLEELSSHQEWKIREKCATVIRYLRGSDTEEIKTRAYEFHKKMKLTEFCRLDPHTGVLNTLNLVPLKPPHVEEIKQIRENRPRIKTNIHGIKVMVGREQEFNRIDEHFKEANLVALVGQGGIGKTTLALKYGQESMHCYTIVHEINCESEHSLNIGMGSLARALGLKCEKSEELLESLRTELNTLEESILIILDNALNQDQIFNFYTNNQKVKFLVCSRSMEWDCPIIHLLQLSVEASVKLLENKLGKNTSTTDLRALADILGHWPLALEQTAGIITSGHHKLKTFINSFGKSLSHDQKMEKIVISQFANISEPAKIILNLLSTCNSQKIRESLVRKMFLQECSDDDWWESRAKLIKSYIISIDNHFWNIHRMIHGYIQKNYPLKNYQRIVEYYCEVFTITSDIWIDHKRVEKLKDLRPHVESLVNLIKITSLQEFIVFYNLIYFYTKVEPNFKYASTLLAQAISHVKAYDFDQSDLAEIYKRIGQLYGYQSEFTKSEQFYLQALKIREEILPQNDPKIADILAALGVLSYFREDHARSEEFYLKALSIREEVLDPLDPDLASLYMNLGTLYKATQNYPQSEEYYRKALEIQTEILEPNHPDLASLYMNIGILYCELSQFDTSEDFYLKALEIREEVLPPSHPDMATIYTNLGNLYGYREEEKKSGEFYLKALKIREEILPPKHPEIANLYGDLGTFYYGQRNYEKSEEFYLKALRIREGTSLNSCDLASLYANLGNLYQAMNEIEMSEDSYFKALTIRKKYIDKYKPDTAKVFMGLGRLYQKKANYNGSEEYFQNALKITTEICPAGHPDILNIRKYLGVIYQLKAGPTPDDEYELLE